MKNKTLKSRTDFMIESVKRIEEYHILGHELQDIGRLISHMACHMADLQIKVDSQAEALRQYQKGGVSNETDRS